MSYQMTQKMIIGFKEATDDLTKSIKEKGKVVVTNVIDAEDDILEISDNDDIKLIHFESDLIDDPELESHYFEKCGMINELFSDSGSQKMKTRCIWQNSLNRVFQSCS